MDTKPLERFATWARRELITAVEAQATAILSAGSVARTERATAIKTLENEISRHGREHVIDMVAYTWFNRIIALRFMDARNYTDAGVVSPAQGQTHGQPEILADAKRGNLDADVVTSARAVDAIIGLLDGTRRSTDAEGEAYALLLTEYCRYWHKSMPFMFEREGDYTELLVPANLLADGAILSRAVEVLTEEVCDDVEVIGWLYQFYISERKDEVFAGFKKNKKAGADEIPAATQLFTPHWIVRYLVENSLGRLWMLNRPSSSLVKQMDYYIAPVDEETDFLKIVKPEELSLIDPACGSGHMLTYAFDLLYAIYEEEGYAPSEIPGLILTHNLYGTEIDPRAGALAAFALTMKARAKQRTFLNKRIASNICVIEPISFGLDETDFLWALTRGSDLSRADADGFWNIFEHADTFGSLIQPNNWLAAHFTSAIETANSDELITDAALSKARRVLEQAEYLTRKYAVAVANPPYMGAKNQSAALSTRLAEQFPEGKSDLFSAFALRCLDVVYTGGQVGLMTPFVWMFITSYEALRKAILDRHTLTSLIQLEYSGFDGATVPICAYTVERGHRSSVGAFIRLSDFVGAAQQEPRTLEIIEDDRLARSSGKPTERGMEKHLYRVESDDLDKVPGSPIAYWLSDAMRAAFVGNGSLKTAGTPRQGMATADNARFVRQWWEVSRGRCGFEFETREGANVPGIRWFPYTDGGDFRRWYGNRCVLVNWEEDGRELRAFGRSVIRNPEYYFKESVSWSAVGSGVPAFRYAPAGSLFSNAGMSFFASSSQLNAAAAICNSTTAERLFSAIAPTLNLGVGEIGKLPIRALPEDVTEKVNILVNGAKNDWDDFETSWDFEAPSFVNTAPGSLFEKFAVWSASSLATSLEQQRLETENNRIVASAYGLADEVPIEVPLHRVSLTRNVEFRYGPGKTAEEYVALERTDVMAEFVSYAVGCMFGRYSLDVPGLILADQGSKIQDYLATVPNPSFDPDNDNVLPIVDGDWFEDDIVTRFRQFLRTALGAEHFAENLRFVEESLGVKTLRDYFITKAGKSKFYDDHVKRYKKRPIYWMFSSPKGSFNALIYLHRYSESTVSTVLNEYLREYRGKLENALQHAEHEAAGDASAKAQKEADRIRIILAELRDYEHDVLYPLATKQISIDLDDGVKANYPKLGKALKPIKGLELAG